jgi:hypothetical protein
MSKPAKPAIVRYYVDADVLGLAKILVQVRGDVTYPGDPGGPVKGGRVRAPCTITQVDTDDEIWIPETARQVVQSRFHRKRRPGRCGKQDDRPWGSR